MRRSQQLETRMWLTVDETQSTGLLLQKLPEPEGVHKNILLEEDADAWNRVTTLANTVHDDELANLPFEQLLRRLFYEEDVRLLTTIAANVGAALSNAQLFAEVEEAREAAVAADESKSDFLSGVSHELRTPLTSVLGFARIIQKELEGRVFPTIQSEDRKVERAVEGVSEDLRIIISEGERLTALINNVLDLAKIESGKIEWHMETVRVPDVIERAIAATSSLFEQNNLVVIKDFAASLPPVIGDQDKLIQVMINLISNAVKFTDQGSVTCRAQARGHEIVVSVVDTGMGISPEDYARVFEKFKQVGDTLTNKPKGTGLGLPICKEIIEHHGVRPVLRPP